jgi:hypothetical protein
MGTQTVSAAFGIKPAAPAASQVTHEMPSAETLPAPHGTQVVESVAPVAVLFEPGMLRHEPLHAAVVRPYAEPQVPAGQGVQALAPASEYLPGGQRLTHEEEVCPGLSP